MKYLLALLMLITSPAWAGWELVAKNADGVQFFIDFQTIRKEGKRVKVWQLTNLSSPIVSKGIEIFSLRARYEFDCNKEQIRMLTITAFSDIHAEGKVLKNQEGDLNWDDIAPETVTWAVLQSVCKAPAR